MTVTEIVGLSWGDEGKGRIVDYISGNYDVICRYGGGANAGHTLVVGDNTYVTRLLPSGIITNGKLCVLGQGMVIDPKTLMHELEVFSDFDIENRILISDRAHIVMPYHKTIDRQTGSKIGTTGNGIGQAYQDKMRRTGIRMGDLVNFDIDDISSMVVKNCHFWLGMYIKSVCDASLSLLEALSTRIKHMIGDASGEINSRIKKGNNILLEGAQGTFLDIDYGTYPYVSSSSNTAAGACLGAGIAPKYLTRVIGISKAYVTRVGNGPFPTEITDNIATLIAKNGKEIGTVTKRPRRIGWLDLDSLNNAIMINGVDKLVITKVDVLSGVCPIYVKANNKLISFDGWDLDVIKDTNITFYKGEKYSSSGNDNNLMKFIRFIEKQTKVPIEMISFGAERGCLLKLLNLP